MMLALTPAAQADDDFGIWTGVEAEKKISNKFSVNAGVNFRTEQKLQSVGRWGATLGGDYKLIKGAAGQPFSLKLGAGYSFLYARSPQEAEAKYNSSGIVNGYNVDHGFWRSKHRAFFDVSGKVGIGRFTLGVRERYQFTHHMGADYLRDRYRGLAPGGFTGPVYDWGGPGRLPRTRRWSAARATRTCTTSAPAFSSPTTSATARSIPACPMSSATT